MALHPNMTCPYCDRSRPLHPNPQGPECNDVCTACVYDVHEWMREDLAQYEANAEGYGGPHYADTMSGGCVVLSN